MDKSSQKIIAYGYRNAGEDFLAAKLKKIFSFIETPTDIAIHNDMLNDVMAMIADEAPQMRKGIARLLLMRPANLKSFIKDIARIILGIGAKNASS